MEPKLYSIHEALNMAKAVYLKTAKEITKGYIKRMVSKMEDYQKLHPYVQELAMLTAHQYAIDDVSEELDEILSAFEEQIRMENPGLEITSECLSEEYVIKDLVAFKILTEKEMRKYVALLELVEDDPI